LIWPGENGILYTFKLNTNYDLSGGTISISPDTPISTRYTTARSGNDKYWLGYEASASVVDGYLYISENGGLFYCIDLNTMELVWAQDTVDDSNSSPVFQSDGNGGGYIYTAPSLHWTKDASNQGSVSLYKLDALTGQILWEKPFAVHTVDGVSGGVQSTPLLGKAGTDIENLIFYTVARTPNKESGLLIALDTATGQEVWRWNMPHYAWSSPVAFYTEAGSAYLVVCDSAGDATLLDAKTGQILHSIDLGFLVEASPAVFGNMLVVGTRGKLICGVKIQ
jgi:outer membrane protein assembly factor BamB